VAAQLITLVFTDVVGSSAAKRHADLGSNASARDRAYLEAIQIKHLRVVRDAVAEHGGKEIMTMGDAFFLTFEQPIDALLCCTAIHQGLLDHPIATLNGPLCLRIGLHTGAPEYFEGSWHGTDVDIAARVQSVATPRQIVVTQVTRQLLGDVLGVKFRPLGTFALKGVGDVKLWDADYDHHGLRLPALRSNEQNQRVKRLKLAVSILSVLFSLAMISWQLWRQHESKVAPITVQSAHLTH
jgi:class 3 adenylate cyclase